VPTDPGPDAESARRSARNLLIIFGVGGVATVLAIVWVMRHMPAGHLADVDAPAPNASQFERTDPANVCKKFGDRCDLGGGQLGACIQRENCEGPRCLYCQDQH
jgi:hypothetical protein